MKNIDLKQLFSRLKRPRAVQRGPQTDRDWKRIFITFLCGLLILVAWHGYQAYSYLRSMDQVEGEAAEGLDIDRLEKVSAALEEKRLEFEKRVQAVPVVTDPAL